MLITAPTMCTSVTAVQYNQATWPQLRLVYFIEVSDSIL